MRRTLNVLIGIALGLLVAVWLIPRGDGAGAGTEFDLPEPWPAPGFTLEDTGGRTVELEDLLDRPTVVFFGFTHCPDVCPATMASLGAAVERLEGGPDRVRVAFVSVDPERDVPERLRAYVNGFHPTFLGLRGSPAEVRDVADRWGVFVQKVEDGAHGGYRMDHTARAFVVGPEGRIQATFPPGTPPADLARGLAAVLERT